MQDGAGIMEYGGYIGKAIEHGEEGPPTNLICLLERWFFSPFGQEIIGANNNRASLHSAMILRVYKKEYILAAALPERGRMFFPHAETLDSSGRAGLGDIRPCNRDRIGILFRDASLDAKLPSQ
jgi:hypothetical protein